MSIKCVEGGIGVFKNNILYTTCVKINFNNGIIQGQNMGKMSIQLANTLFNRLHTLAVEYSVSTDIIVNVAIKKLIDDVDLMRDLRTGRIKSENHAIYPNYQNG
jgi:hypothetical protein